MVPNPSDEWPPKSPEVEDPEDAIRQSGIADHLNFDFDDLLNFLAEHAENADGKPFIVHGNLGHLTSPSVFRVHFKLQHEASPKVFRITAIDQIY